MCALQFYWRDKKKVKVTGRGYEGQCGIIAGLLQPPPLAPPPALAAFQPRRAEDLAPGKLLYCTARSVVSTGKRFEWRADGARYKFEASYPIDWREDKHPFPLAHGAPHSDSHGTNAYGMAVMSIEQLTHSVPKLLLWELSEYYCLYCNRFSYDTSRHNRKTRTSSSTTKLTVDPGGESNDWTETETKMFICRGIPQGRLSQSSRFTLGFLRYYLHREP